MASDKLKWYEKHFRVDISEVNPYKSGSDKFVLFRNGVGLLNLETVGRQKMHWVKTENGKMVPMDAAPYRFKNFIDYWKRKGATVEEITADQAAEMLKHLESETIQVPPELAKTPKDAISKAGSDSENRAVYVCEKCGAKFETDFVDGAADCPQCGNASGVLYEQKGTDAGDTAISKTKLKKMKKDDLLKMAESLQIEVPEGINKPELIDLLASKTKGD